MNITDIRLHLPYTNLWIINMNRVLLRKWLLLVVMLVPLCTMAQKISVRGRVTAAEDGQNIPGAAVK